MSRLGQFDAYVEETTRCATDAQPAAACAVLQTSFIRNIVFGVMRAFGSILVKLACNNRPLLK